MIRRRASGATLGPPAVGGLRLAVRAGTYVVDEYAVADAIIRRLRLRSLGVLVAGQLLQPPAVGRLEHHAGTGGHLA